MRRLWIRQSRMEVMARSSELDGGEGKGRGGERLLFILCNYSHSYLHYYHYINI